MILLEAPHRFGRFFMIRKSQMEPGKALGLFVKGVCLQKVLDKSGIKTREGFRFQIPFSGRLSNL